MKEYVLQDPSGSGPGYPTAIDCLLQQNANESGGKHGGIKGCQNNKILL
jgi:hypothetical protein